ncbi:MAG: DUF1987 domain-containing protein [Bacteroidota bacterium]
MESIDIEGTDKTPTINFDAEKGLIEIKGKSIPENSLGLYDPLLSWLDKYSAVAPPMTNVNIHLEYFNTASSKCILDIFRKLESIHHESNTTKIVINWYYDEDDEDMLEAGGDYELMIDVPFEMKKVKIEIG